MDHRTLIAQTAVAIEEILAEIITAGKLDALGDNKGQVTTLRVNHTTNTVYNHQLVLPTDTGKTAVVMFDAWAVRNVYNISFRAIDSAGYICSEVWWERGIENSKQYEPTVETLKARISPDVVRMLNLAKQNAGLDKSVRLAEAN